METQKIMSADNTNIIEIIKHHHGFASAIRLAIRQSKNDIHKQAVIYLELGIDKSNWSRIMSGQASLSPDLIPLFCDIVGNDIVIHWLAYQRGYELRFIPKVLEDQLNEKEEQNKRLQNEVDMLREALKVLGEGIQRKEKKTAEKKEK